MKMRRWTGLLVIFILAFGFIGIKGVSAVEKSNLTSSDSVVNQTQIQEEHKYSVDLAASSVKNESKTYVNPIYKGLDVSSTNSKTFENLPSLAGSSGQAFSTINDAGTYLRQQMVQRASTVTFSVNTGYYSGVEQDIFKKAVADGYGSSEGDYLYAHFSAYRVSISYTSGKVALTYNMSYLSTYAEEQAVNSEVNRVLNSLNVYNSDEYTKIKAVHDYIVQNIQYDYSLQNYSAYNAIVQKSVVCQGFSSVTYKMLKELGVGVRYISGMGNGGRHAWNIVRIGGKWYNIDNTWDENLSSYSNLSYEYFLKSNNDFGGHIRDSEYDGSFNQKYPMASASYVYNSTAVTTGIPVASIALNTKSLNLQVGNSGSFIAGVLPSNASNKEVTWQSSNTNVATVNAQGNVTAVGLGTATITCTASDGSGQTATGVVNVTSGTQIKDVKVSSIKLNQKSLNLILDKTSKLLATLSPKNATNKEVTWQSSDVSVATVDADGNVTAVGVGTATITCTAKDGSNKSATSIIKVTDGKVKVSSIRLNQKSLNLIIDKAGKLIASISPRNATNKEVTWESSDISVATVDENGNVTAVGVGTATITCTAKDGSNKSAISTIKVTDGKVKVSSIRLNQRSLNLIIDKTAKLMASISPRNATNKEVTWESSDVSVVTVDENGNVTAVGVGAATITCTAKDGSEKAASCIVKVNN